ncbi:hypothetical protein AC579_2506 [Pseudocercospora musae]|uniref:Acyltransferase 3 domain-containing protein n=1 Tax=Pseudocercospora musae TaxID=113226 RepID=A0A139I4E0_9PEZI|nr:hypothetical protein AC579_2506 [Pseudocercospora musae]
MTTSLDDDHDEGLPLHHVTGDAAEQSARRLRVHYPGDEAAMITAKQPKQDHRQAYLDGLRGLASLLVYIYHHISWFYGPEDDIINGFGSDPVVPRAQAASATGELAPPNYFFAQLPFVRLIWTGGNAAVHTFFVLSGYVLSISMLRKLSSTSSGMDAASQYRSLVSSFIRRPFRLFVPVLGVSLVTAMCWHLPFGLAPVMAWPSPEDSFLKELWRWVTQSLWLMNPFEPHGVLTAWYVYNPPAYTMPIEWIGSMVVFGGLGLAVTFSARMGQKALMARAILFLAAFVFFLTTYQWAAACFVGGMLLALNEVEGFDALAQIKHYPPGIQAFHHLVLIWGLYVLSEPASMEVSAQTPGYRTLTYLIPKNYYEHEYWRWWHSWGAIFLVFGVLKIQWLQRFLTTRPVHYLGWLSFSLYLVHGPLLWTLSDRMYRLFGNVRVAEINLWIDHKLEVPDFGIHGLSTRFLLTQIIVLPMNLALAHFTTVLLDERSVRLGKWIVQRLSIERKT